jgi:twitching motility two-component system response regulator PilG
MKKSRVMIVEDEESLLKLESILLSAKGYKVTGVMDGRMALEEISTEMPDLVLLDIMLPSLDGFEVCRRIKENPETSTIPVVMLTARKNSQDRAHGLEAGADAYITKPFKSAQVLETIESLLNKGIVRVSSGK